MNQPYKSYYINIENGEIQQTKQGEWHFEIFAPEEEAAKLSNYMRQNYNAELKTYVRAHVPYLEPSKKSQNEEYDRTIENIYAMIYKYGDEEAKRHVEKMGIITEETLTRIK